MEYKISNFNKVLRSLFFILLLVIGVVFLAMPFKGYFQIIAGCIFILVGIYVFADAFLKTLLIDENGITLKGLFINRTFSYNEIKGFRLTTGKTTFLVIVPLARSTRSMRISSDFKQFKEIQDQLKTKITDLDEEVFQQENQQILGNEDFGSSDDERDKNRKKATKFTLVLVVVSSILFFILLVFDFYEPFMPAVAFVISVAPFYLIWRFKGLIQIFDNTRKSAYIVIAPAIFLSAGLLVLVVLKSLGTICNYDNFWKPAFIIFIISGAIMFSVCKKTLAIANSKVGSIIILVLFLCAFSYSATVFSDQYFDNSAVKTYSVTVLDKSVSVSSKGHRSYWLKLTPWGIMQDTKQDKVSLSFYNEVEIGDSLHILFKEGKLGMPWYNVVH